jgi:plasmid stabilization system protein ParE
MVDGRLQIHPEVEDIDLLEIASEIGQDNPEASDRVIGTITETFRILAGYPGLGVGYLAMRKHLKGIRMMPVTPYRNYLIFYRPLPDDAGVRILYVLHGARDIAGYIKDSGRQ